MGTKGVFVKVYSSFTYIASPGALKRGIAREEGFTPKESRGAAPLRNYSPFPRPAGRSEGDRG